MRIAVENFRGEIPRFAPRLLPDGFAQLAQNTRLLSGDLEPWRGLLQVATVAKTPPINTIYLLAEQYWLTWMQSELAAGAYQVDVARSSLAGDTNNRIFLTGLDCPRWTNVPLATTGVGAYPIETRPLGVPAPVNAPLVLVQPGPTQLANFSDAFNAVGGWTLSTGATIQGSGGNPGGRLQLSASAPSTAAEYAYQEFDVTGCRLLDFECDVRVDTRDGAGHWNLQLYLTNDSTGQGTRIALMYVDGAWQLGTVVGVSWADLGSPSVLETATNPPDATWLHFKVQLIQSTTSGWDATATLTNGAAVIASGTFPVQQAGDFFGFGVDAPSSGGVVASVDNFALTGSSTLPATEVTDNFAQNNGWTFGGIVGTSPGQTTYHDGTSFFYAEAQVGPSTLNPAGAFHLYSFNCARPVFARRDFAVDGSASVNIEFDYQADPSAFRYGSYYGHPMFNLAVIVNDATGVGAGVWIGTTGTVGPSALIVQTGNTSAVGGWPSTAAQVQLPTLTALLAGHTYHFKINLTKGASGNGTMTLVISEGGTVLDQCSLSCPQFSGSFVNLMGWDTDDAQGWAWDLTNFALTSSAPPSVTTQNATSYVVTYVNDQGEESAPSPASATLLRDDGTTVEVTTDTVPPKVTPPADGDWFIVSKNIYRAVTGASTTDYFFVANIPLAQQVYLDGATDAQLPGDTLQSTDYDLPPSDLRGIRALPNGIYAGFSGNQLCLSEQGVPHAWPVIYRKGVDWPIVLLEAIDNVVVLGTQGNPYVAMGTTPANFTPARVEVPQGAIAPRSGAYLKGVGVVFATPDGLLAVAGPGLANLITAGHFSKREWQALNPASILGRQYDDRYVAFYEVEGPNAVDAAVVTSGIPYSPYPRYGVDFTTEGANSAVVFLCAALDTSSHAGYLLPSGHCGDMIPNGGQPGGNQPFYQNATVLEGGGNVPGLSIATCFPGNTGLWTAYVTNNFDPTAFTTWVLEAALATGYDTSATWSFTGAAYGTPVGGTITTANDHELLIAIAAGDAGSTAATPLFDSSWTVLPASATLPTYTSPDSGTYPPSAITPAHAVVAYKVAGPAGVQDVAINSSADGSAGAVAVIALQGNFTPGVKGGMLLELGQGGFGKVTLSMHASALHSDFLNDTLYMVTD